MNYTIKQWQVLTTVSSIVCVFFIIVSVMMTQKYNDTVFINETLNKICTIKQQNLDELTAKQATIVYDFEKEMAAVIDKGEKKKKEIQIEKLYLEVKIERLRAELQCERLVGEAKLKQIKIKLSDIIHSISMEK